MRTLLCATLLTAALVPAVSAQNLLTNPGFENGLNGWGAFGNALSATNSPPNVVPRTGNGIATIFGNFSGGFDVSGVFQSFPALPGQTFTIDCWSRHFSGDALTGNGPPNFNWAVMKIAFFDAGGTEIAGAEGIVLDGTSPTDTWIDNQPVSGTAPAGTASVQALLLFLQPANDGGAAQFDDVVFTGPGGGPAYPGPGDDLVLATGIGGSQATSGPGFDVKQAPAGGGALLEVEVSSPAGAYALQPYLVVAQVFSTGNPPVPQVPNLWIDLTAPAAFVVGASGPPFSGPVIVPGGSSSFFVLPAGLGGSSIMLQALVVTNSSANGLFALSDAHEIQLQ